MRSRKPLDFSILPASGTVRVAARCRLLGYVTLGLLALLLAPGNVPGGPSAAAAETGDAAIASSAPMRLSRDVEPVFQFVELELDADQASYSGKVRIDLDVNVETKSFGFHARDITFDSLVIAGSSGRWDLEPTSSQTGLVTVQLPEPLERGRYQLMAHFSADFGTQAVGLYRMDLDGRGYAFTQFEAIDARRAFPCWDEPSFKFPYQVRLIVPAGHEAVSNTPVEKEETLDDGRRSLLFKQTKPMPSYLLAIATGPLESVPMPGLEVPARIYTVQGHTHLTELAVEMTPPILGALEEFFGTPYPYEKLDFISVPEFWPGAMENAGAITFAEPLLAIDTSRATLGQRRNLAGAIAHELAHQWYGNLVTMEWWDDLWLNEAFAYWMGETISDAAFPDLRTWLETVQGRQMAMNSDARLTSRAVRQPVKDLVNLLQASDVLTNHKGKTVLAMVNRWIGPETFRDGVRSYLEAHAWGNARGADLWDALSEASGKDVGAVMTSFLEQPGLPLITAQVEGGGLLRLTQSRFLHEGAEVPEPQLWKIPINIRYGVDGREHTSSIFLDTRETAVTIGDGKDPDWLLLNDGEVGYYRWSASSAMLDALTGEHADKLDVVERMTMVDNIAALLDGGHISGGAFLEYLGRFADDEDPSVLGAMLGAIGLVESAFVTEDLVDAFAAYVRATLRPALDRYGMEAQPDEAEAISLVRDNLISWLGDRGRDPEMLAFAREQVGRYLEDPASVDPSLVTVVLRLAALEGDAELFEAYKSRFENAEVPADRTRFLFALGSFRDPELMQRALDYNMTGPIRPQELFTILQGIASYPPNESVPYEWMTANYEVIAGRVPPMFVAYFPWAAAGCNQDLVDRANVFFSEPAHQGPGTEIELAKVMEQVSSCVGLRAREGQAVREYLSAMAAGMD